MKVLVTGATGFIGRRVVAQLAARAGVEVVACGLVPDARLPAVPFEALNLLDPGAAAALVKRVRPSHVVHLAWDARPGKFWSSPENLLWAAVSAELMAAFVAAGGHRIVGAGTCAEYDWTTGAGRLAEDAPIAPATLYGKAKDATRRLWIAAGEKFDVSVAWGRVFWLYGPGEAPGRLVPDVCRALRDGTPVETTDGHQRRDFSHVDDVAAAFVAALASDWEGPFNIGSGDARPVREIVGALGRTLGREDLVHFGARPSPPDEPPLIEADTAILADRIGVRPAISLADGLAATARWWQTAPA